MAHEVAIGSARVPEESQKAKQVFILSLYVPDRAPLAINEPHRRK